MNTKDKWTITATIDDEERRALWSDVFPDGRVPIKVPVAYEVSVPVKGQTLAYELDLDALSDEQRQGVVETISRAFNLPIEDVEDNIKEIGVPVLDEGVTVTVTDNAYFGTALDINDVRPIEDDDLDEEFPVYYDTQGNEHQEF